MHESRGLGDVYKRQGNGSFGVELFDGLGRVAGRHRIGRDVPGHHGAGAHDAVFPDGDTFADNGAVPDPDIVGNVNRSGSAGDDTVVKIVLVRIGYKRIVGKHAAVADADFIGRTDADTRADHTVVPDMYAAFSRALGPDGNPYIFV